MIYRRILLLVLLAFLVHAKKPMGFPWSKVEPQNSNDPLPYNVLYYKQKVSHFNFQLTGQTWKQKYLINMTHWSKQQKGPIIMYCGNQGPIEMFFRNVGWYNDYVTKDLKGLLVFPQHRYFGESWPFGDKKTSFQKQNLKYLTTEEAMMDFVEFIQFIKKTYCQDCPVIVFGGSYGGMLAAWMRMKYPNVVDMAHASSAPIYYYRNRKDFDIGIFYKIVTKNYAMHNQNCPNVIRQAYKRLLEFNQSPSAPLSDLNKWFNLCKPLKTYVDIAYLINYISTGYSYMAMINYPYPTSFLKNVTAWPANSSCMPLDQVKPSSSNEQLFTAIRKSVEYYYSFNKTKCNQIFDDESSDEDMGGWNILACADQAMPMSTDGKQDMFYKQDFDYDGYNAQCKRDFGLTPDYEYTLNHFGGITDRQYLSASKIVFTNGALDPWSGASPTKTLTPELPSCLLPNGAHHLELRPPNPADPSDATACRQFVMGYLKKWLSEYKISQNNNLIRTQ